MPFGNSDSNGEVHSAHSGRIYKHSECSVEVQHNYTWYSTYYSHLELNDILDGTFIEQGESIGRISLDPHMSNCGCDPLSPDLECASGPHVHFELRYYGMPASLDGRVISNIRVKTGLLPHDLYCSYKEDCTMATFGGRPCSTTYTSLITGEVLCPTPSNNGSRAGKADLNFFKRVSLAKLSLNIILKNYVKNVFFNCQMESTLQHLISIIVSHSTKPNMVLQTLPRNAKKMRSAQ